MRGGWQAHYIGRGTQQEGRRQFSFAANYRDSKCIMVKAKDAEEEKERDINEKLGQPVTFTLAMKRISDL